MKKKMVTQAEVGAARQRMAQGVMFQAQAMSNYTGLSLGFCMEIILWRAMKA